MTVEKLSVSVPHEVAELIRAAAAQAGMSVSSWITDAARKKLAGGVAAADAVTAAEELLASAVAEHGPPTAADLAWVAEVLTASGSTGRRVS